MHCTSCDAVCPLCLVQSTPCTRRVPCNSHRVHTVHRAAPYMYTVRPTFVHIRQLSCAFRSHAFAFVHIGSPSFTFVHLHSPLLISVIFVHICSQSFIPVHFRSHLFTFVNLYPPLFIYIYFRSCALIILHSRSLLARNCPAFVHIRTLLHKFVDFCSPSFAPVRIRAPSFTVLHFHSLPSTFVHIRYFWSHSSHSSHSFTSVLLHSFSFISVHPRSTSFAFVHFCTHSLILFAFVHIHSPSPTFVHLRSPPFTFLQVIQLSRFGKSGCPSHILPFPIMVSHFSFHLSLFYLFPLPSFSPSHYSVTLSLLSSYVVMPPCRR